MARIEKGKFIKAGCGPGKYTPASRGGLILEVVFIPVFLVLLMILFLNGWAKAGFSLFTVEGAFNFFLFIFLGVMLFGALPRAEGGSIDAIYEKGLTIRQGIKTSDVRHGRHWFPWEKITRIEYGLTKGARYGYYQDSGYFRLLTPERETKKFIEIEYRTGKPVEYYTLLWQKLYENCRNAKWVKHDILEGPWTGHPEYCR